MGMKSPTWNLWRLHLARIKSHMLLSRIQRSPIWIDLWRHLLPTITLSKVQVHSTRLENELDLEINATFECGMFHEFYVLHFGEINAISSWCECKALYLDHSHGLIFEPRWVYWAWLWYKCSIAFTIKHCSTFSSTLSMSSHICQWVHQGHDVALNFTYIIWLTM